MDDFFAQVLNLLPSDDTSVDRLRLAYVGATMDIDALVRVGFQITRSAANGFTQLVLTDTAAGRRLSMVLSPSSIMCRIWSSVYKDHNAPDVSVSANGWYLSDDVDTAVEEEWSITLNQCATRLPISSAEDDWKWHIVQLNEQRTPFKQSNDPAYLLCCHACDCMFSTMWYSHAMASLMATVLARHADQISDEDALNDLPFVAGKMHLHGDCIRATRTILNRRIDLPAEGWNNIGSVLCDKLRLFEPSIAFFERAIGMSPYLYQPNMSMWVAGHK